MADSYTQASFGFSCSNAEMALLEEAFLAADSLAGDYDPDPPSPEFLAVFPQQGDDIWGGLRGIFTDPDHPGLGAEIEGGNTLADPDRCQVVIYGMTDFEPGAVAALIQRCCRATLAEAPIGFEYSWRCSKPRIGEFGGGWFVVHSDRIDSGETSDALAAALQR